MTNTRLFIENLAAIAAVYITIVIVMRLAIVVL